MFKIEGIKFSESGKKIIYDYSYTKQLSRFFNEKEKFYCSFDVDVSSTPKSLAIIPFLSNIIPISWFVGFEIYLDELDEDFMAAINVLKGEFIKAHPKISTIKSGVVVKKVIKNNYETTKTAMLFSGGVDAYTTYFRNFDKIPDLITIHGADVEIKDTEQWERIIFLNKREEVLSNNTKHYIESNLRAFYTHQVDLLLPNLGWWGKVQHGLALNGLIAPLSFVKGYKESYIASSYTDNIDIAWGSTPDIDNNIKWGGTSIIHDGYELKRQDKIDFIVGFVKKINKTANLRVCYSLLNKKVNCSRCEKCCRTIIAILLNNESPSKYGFDIDEKIYDEIIKIFKKGISSKGTKYFWWEISEKIKSNHTLFILKDEELELEKLKELNNAILFSLSNTDVKTSKIARVKFRLQKKFPKAFKYYLKTRQRK
ncbi:hypothetical protein [Tenacibaculum retecalamus]|uniref:hypothetical protein n=1 Tax=Tenacibaculum retecalamus TaxID=3018315 RepID=UPI0023D94401|nr:hypothetical protein [Tenacibaculum retecalamus]WBX70737.1 hypothetical protein PG912_10885 [Tenacibaculum retecalamus]